MAHLSYKEFKDKFGDLGITEWVKYNWIGWSSDKVAYYLRLHLSEITEIDFDDTDVVDLGSLTWTRMYYDNRYVFFASNPTQALSTINYLCINYSVALGLSSIDDKQITGNGGAGTSIWIRDDSYTNSNIFKLAMSGVLLAYEKA